MSHDKYLSKIVLCGDYEVGKTSLRRNFMGLSFKWDHQPTLGVDFSIKTIQVQDNVTIELQIWDFGGQVAFKTLRQRYLIGVGGVILVFDQTNRESFNNLEKWLDEIWHDSRNLKAPIIILGNKADLKEFQVQTHHIQDFIKKVNERSEDVKIIDYYVTSAKTGLNVEESFTDLAREIYSNEIKKEE